MKYENYELLELFENEPEIIDSESWIFRYDTKEILGFTLSLFVWGLDDYVLIHLKYKDFQYPIFEFEIQQVQRIEAKNNKLFIYKQNIEEPMIVFFKPNFSISGILT